MSDNSAEDLNAAEAAQPKGNRVMATTVQSTFASGFNLSNIISEVEKGTTVAESLMPLMESLIAEAVSSAGNPLALVKLAFDVVKALPQIEAAFAANNTQVTVSAGGAATTNPS